MIPGLRWDKNLLFSRIFEIYYIAELEISISDACTGSFNGKLLTKYEKLQCVLKERSILEFFLWEKPAYLVKYLMYCIVNQSIQNNRRT